MDSRRDFLTTASLAVAGLALAPLAACSQHRTAPASASSAAPSPVAPRTGALLTRTIPATGEAVPVIGMGTSGSFEVQPGSPEYDALKQVLQTFFDGGGTLIDTSPNYGNADDVLGELLAEGGHRGTCFLATKIAADDRASAQAQWAESLRRLQDRPGRTAAGAQPARRSTSSFRMRASSRRRAGRSYIGLTHFVDSAHGQLADVLRREKPDFVQINYSVSAPGAARTVFPVAQELGIAVMVNRAFDDGKLFAQVAGKPLPGWAADVGVDSWAQMFLKFAISHPAVTVVIPATGKPERQADNLKGGTGPLLSQAQQDELTAMFA